MKLEVLGNENAVSIVLILWSGGEKTCSSREKTAPKVGRKLAQVGRKVLTLHSK
jgi:hypothetical protein